MPPTVLRDDDAQLVRSRLTRIEGVIGGIRRMVEDDRPNPEIMQQLRAAEAALKAVTVAVLRAHVDQADAAGAEELRTLLLNRSPYE